MRVRAFDTSGNLLAEGTAAFQVNAVTRLSGGVTVDPPIVQAGLSQAVHVTADITNFGNLPLPAGPLQLTATLTTPDPSVGAAAQGVFLPGELVGTPLNNPIGAGFDAQGNFYTVNKVADTGVNPSYKVFRIAAADGQVKTYQLLATLSSPTLTVTPQDAVVDAAGNVYVLNFSPQILQIPPTVWDPTPTGTVGRIATGLSNQVAFDRDASGTYFVHNGFTVVKIDPLAGPSTFFSSGGLSTPVGLARGADGSLYAANSSANSVVRVATDGTITTFAVGAPLSSPKGLTIDSSGSLYVANNLANNVVKITSGGAMSVYATGFTGPNDLAIDTQGNLYVTNSNNTVSRVLSGAAIPATAQPFVSVSNPTAISVDASGTVFVGSGGQVLKFTSSGQSNPPYATGVNALSLTFDAAGFLYATTSPFKTIVRIDSNGAQTLVGTNAEGGLLFGLSVSTSGTFAVDQSFNMIRQVVGTDTQKNIVPFAAGLADPRGVRADGSGGVFVANNGNATVGHILNHLSSQPQQIRSVATRLTQPRAVAIASTGELLVGGNLGNLYVVDSSGHATDLLSLASLYTGGNSGIASLAVNSSGVINAVSTFRNEIDRISYIPAGSGPTAGTVAFTTNATLAASIPVDGSPVLVDFGTWTPPYSGDFRLTVSASSASGTASNVLHVGPNATATLSPTKASLPPGNSPVGINVNIDGGDFTTLSKIGGSPITTIIPASAAVVISAIGADAAGNTYVTNGSTLTRFAPGPGFARTTLYSVPAGQTMSMAGTVPVDSPQNNLQNVYIAAGVGAKDIIRVGATGAATTLATLTEAIKSLVRGSGDVIYALGTANIFRVTQAGAVSTVATGGVSSSATVLAIDGRDNLYVQYSTAIDQYRLDGTRSNVLRQDGLQQPVFETTTAITGDCADNLFVIPTN
ncbi:MAG TPA: hypothetical protein VF921_14305, partial [Vicinamibacterales bacterium]